LWEVNELFEYWRDYPPTHILVSAYLTGGKQSSSDKNRLKSNSNLDDLAQAVSLAGGRVSNKRPRIYQSQ